MNRTKENYKFIYDNIYLVNNKNMFGFDKLPDNTDKILLILCLVGFYLIGSRLNNEKDRLDNQLIKLHEANDKRASSLVELSDKKIRLIKTSNHISNKYGVANPVTFSDSIVNMSVGDDTSRNYFAASELIMPLFLDYQSLSVRDIVHKYNYNAELQNSKLYKEAFQDSLLGYSIILIMLTALFLISISSLKKKESLRDLSEAHQRLLDKYSLREKGYLKNCCQSCGRMFDSIIAVSKNNDGSFNYSFCSECFSNGNFSKSYEEISQLINRNDEIPEDKKQIYLDYVSNLDRWKTNKYPRL